MIGYENAKLLKLKGSFARTHNSSYLSQHEEDTFSSSLLWNVRYRHIKYIHLHLLKNIWFYGFPTIPKKFYQCDACIIGRHSKQPFHEPKFRACINLELMDYDMCVLVHFSSTSGNKYLMKFLWLHQNVLGIFFN